MSAKRDLPKVLGERYEVGEFLGGGAMSIVHRARDLKERRPVAAKIAFNAHMPWYGSDVHRLEEEASVLLSLQHRRIVRGLDVGSFSNGVYLIMEMLEGRTLKAAIEDTERPISIPRAVTIGAALLEALEVVHEAGFLHRDVKPENVILTPEGLKLIDFGLVRRMRTRDDEEHTEPGIAVGTPQYMAPEQCRGDPLDRRADLYAVGHVLYEMITRRDPHPSGKPQEVMLAKCSSPPKPFSEVAPDIVVPHALQRVVMRVLSIERKARFGSAREMRSALLSAAC